jgi:hypothetical protein
MTLLAFALTIGCAQPEGDDYHDCGAAHDDAEAWRDGADYRDPGECE